CAPSSRAGRGTRRRATPGMPPPRRSPGSRSGSADGVETPRDRFEAPTDPGVARHSPRTPRTREMASLAGPGARRRRRHASCFVNSVSNPSGGADTMVHPQIFYRGVSGGDGVSGQSVSRASRGMESARGPASATAERSRGSVSLRTTDGAPRQAGGTRLGARRVRVALLGAAMVCTGLAPAPVRAAGSPALQFIHHDIDQGVFGQVTEGINVGDIDGDGRPDIVVGGDNYLVWFHNPDWAPNLIPSGFKFAGGASAVVRS